MITSSPFRRLAGHYEDCLRRHGDTPQGVDWPNAGDARTRYRVMAEVAREPAGAPVEWLDFGCGAGHFLDYLREARPGGLAYRGLDLSPAFIDLCRRKFPGIAFDCMDVLESGVTVPTADYAVLNGVFTEKLDIPHDLFFEAVKAVLLKVFAAVRHGMAFNLMSTHVDWTRDDLFHVAYDDIARFIVGRLSRHHVLRADYGLYEYTLYVYKSAQNVS